MITGAGSGLGRSLSLLYAGNDVTLGLIGRNSGRLAETADLCANKGAQVHTGLIDVRDGDGLQQWLTGFDDRYPVDLVIANAGVMHVVPPGTLHEPPEIVRELVDINFIGALNTVNPLLERMISRKQGRAAIISSLSAYHGIPAFPAYSASKAAIKAYYEALRAEYAARGVSISVVCPSYVRTPMTASVKIDQWLFTDVEKAAALIRKGIDKRKALIAFPWYHRLAIWLLDLFPVKLSDRIVLFFLSR